jgi:hypothetical protein
VINERQLSGGLVFNFDETGVRWAEQLKYQFVPTDAQRAESPEGDSSGRFTAMIGASDTGEFFPMFAIVRVKCKTVTNLSTSRILKSLHKPGLLADPKDGWEYRIWEGSVKKVTKAGAESVINYKRPYLFNVNTLDMITVQHKAWMDTPACIMWAELQLKEWRQRFSPCQAPLAIVDNCGCHHVREVKEAFVEAGWELMFLPPNMTGELQVMDLVVNGPVKQHMRKRRIESSLKYFESYKMSAFKALARNEDPPKFCAPVPKMRDGIAALMEIHGNLFVSDKLKKSVIKSFEDTGIKTVEDALLGPVFKQYLLSTRHGTHSTKVPKNLDDEISLGACLLPIDTRNECDSDDDTYERDLDGDSDENNSG